MARLRRSQHSVRFSHRIHPQHRLPRRQRWWRTGRRAGIGVAALAALFFPASALASSTTGSKTSSDIPAFANLKIAGLPTVTASAPARFSAWYRNTGEPVLNSLVQADNDLSRGQYLAGCSIIESVASKGLAQPYPPDCARLPLGSRSDLQHHRGWGVPAGATAEELVGPAVGGGVHHRRLRPATR